MKIVPIGFDFMKPLCEGYTEWVDDDSAEFVLCMNGGTSSYEGHTFPAMPYARELALRYRIPLCFWTIEDPNSFGNALFQQQAKQADFVFTSDRECIPAYHRLLNHERVFWLPLAANQWLHCPKPLTDDATDFVFSGNWYPYSARKWCDETVILPLARAGYSMTIYSYEEPPYPELKKFWKGGTSCYTSAEQYAHGKVVLGANCQRSGLDGIERTVMTSMRTFEALSCGKPFLAPWGEAYEALGLLPNVWRDFNVVDDSQSADHIEAAATVLADGMLKLPSPNGVSDARMYVLANHTYGHRLRRIQAAIAGTADPLMCYEMYAAVIG
jgi:hypothetical protein